METKHKKDPFKIACICILSQYVNQQSGGCVCFSCCTRLYMIATLTTTIINMLSRFILTFTIILGQWLLPCVATCPISEVNMAAVALARRLPRLTGVSAIRHCSGFLALYLITYAPKKTVLIYRVIFFTGTPLKSMENLG